MADLIDRQTAIEALEALCDTVCEYSKEYRGVMCGSCPLGNAFDVLEEAQLVQPENLYRPSDRFCPWCGARMGEEDETD